ncbi:MurR/RpiR family transcriptional regulator [Sphaerisporangium sp. TRM90804]|uniref:MurR/RpiR family transcriptional regulator n=1 Tax=Sphaerisporangium sp. TRM90804 TaxID=3031113 RepID=UPI00244B375A|nr:MurR/RpiR family transcriptional regulator [Sphaerisporangium sp. TRM90804]MDH2430059.1 MurR/RpiR family transcriptional regulator [Sphaerisporangium sp. TRM90804]
MAEGLERLLQGKRLSPVQQRIAQYVDEHLPEAIFLSSVELAVRAGVSQPSVTRFAMALGFAGYPELRQALRPLVVGRDGSPSGQGADGAEGRHDPVAHPQGRLDGERDRGTAYGPPGDAAEASGGPLCAAIDHEIRSLTVIRDHLARDAHPDGSGSRGQDGAGQDAPDDGGLAARIAGLGTALAGCEPLPVLGLREASGPVTTFAYYARRIHPDVRPLVHGGSELADGLHAARRAGAEWLLAVVLPRYPAEAVHALQYAAKLGFRTAAIADRADVPFPCDVVLPAPVRRGPVFDSHAAPLALAMALLEAMAAATPLRTKARIQEHERMADETGVFLPS